MKEIESEINKVISDNRVLGSLLILEKQRRGVYEDKLVFIGIADTANYYWCAMKSFFQNKVMELDFFASYLHDRISYSFDLGLIDEMPRSKEKILDIGSQITFRDVEKLLRERKMRKSKLEVEESYMGIEIFDEEGYTVRIINPYLSSEKRGYYEEQAKVRGIRVANLDEFPELWGCFFQITKAEQYPTIRWNFDWENYVVVGVPDGITDSFVYEFKTTRSRFLSNYVKPVALTQADLYGYFFRRNKKRIQMFIVEEGIIETSESKVDKDEARKVLRNFKKVDDGWMPPPPKPWKCKSCGFQDICKLKAK